MRSSRRFACFLMTGLSALSGISLTQAQMTQINGAPSAQQAYYLPLTDQQYPQHAQAAFVTPAPPQSGLQNLESPMSIRQRAAALLRAQQNAPSSDTGERFQKQIPPFPPRGSNIGYSRLTQDDSFGPRQTQTKIGQESLTDVFGAPPQDNLADPFADPPADPTAKQDEEPEPGAIPIPQDAPPMRDPVLPPDAEFTPDPAPGAEPPKMPEDPKPVVPPPAPPANGAEEPGAVKPPNEVPEPQIDPVPDPDPPAERSKIQDNVYRAPSADGMPPIVQPYQVIPAPPGLQTAPPQMMPSGAPALDWQMGQPFYQPAYQPIPGVPAPPSFVPKWDSGCCPSMVLGPPPETLGGVVMPQDCRPQDCRPRDCRPRDCVYSNVVGDCSTCPTTCSTSCQSRRSGCRDIYFSFAGGFSGLREMVGQSNGGTIETVGGTGFAFALGRQNSRQLRTELELSIRHNDVTGFEIGNISQSFDGELDAFSGMANAYWEFADVRTRCFKPYFGVGIGFVSIDATATDPIGGGSLLVPGTENDTSFAFQWMAGISYKAYRNMELFAEYRFFQANSFDVDSVVPGVSDRYNFDTDNVFGGFRWKF